MAIDKRNLVAGIIALILGIGVNTFSQFFLKAYSQTHELPVLNDIIFDILPFFRNLSFMYDIFAFLSVVVLLSYIIHKKKYEKIPFILIVFGLFYFLRGIFAIITPLGNPGGISGTLGPFKGFMFYELGVYPSGHSGLALLSLIFVSGRYKILSWICLIGIIGFLLITHGHYSIDIFSGVIFAYAGYMFLKSKLVDWEK